MILDLGLERVAGQAEAAGSFADAAAGGLQRADDELFVTVDITSSLDVGW